MNKPLSYFQILLEFFGFKRNSKYVRHYLNESNLRSGMLMAVVIVALEIWLICRQHEKYIIPAVQSGTNYFTSLFDNTSNFWLFLLAGVAMFAFCFTALKKPHNTKSRLVWLLIASGLLFAYCGLAFREPYREWTTTKNIANNVFLILLYALSALFAIFVAIYNIHVFRTQKENDALGLVPITLFALVCLTFGMKVSFSDFGSTREPKMIICFLTMVLYVACLLVWKPYLSIVLLGIIFYGFSLMLQTMVTQREFTSGDRVNYITFYVSLVMVAISLYHQRYNDAKKAEELEYKANFDDLTSLHNFAHFQTFVADFVKRKSLGQGDYVYLFIDVNGFKTINETYGFVRGNEFLISIGEMISKAFGDEFSCRVSDDHFAVFANAEGMQKKIAELIEKTRLLDEHIHPQLKFGAYLYHNDEETPRRAVDKAHYACSLIKHRGDLHYLEYDHEMHLGYYMTQYVTSHVDEAAEKGWIVPFYQPVVFAKGRELCGVEALARWNDPERGFLNPGQFIPILESARLIHKLDVCIFECVCRDLRGRLDQGLPVVPVSLNFSRLDFELMDAVEVFDNIVNRYQIPKDLLHVEITESALSDDVNLLSRAVSEFKKRGYALWLDDFGSGYSSLNVLKDYDFDVLKLDMKFLSGFRTNQKSRPLIRSCIQLAHAMGLKTLCEGVETSDQADFLEEAGCLRLQGYLYGKAMPKEELVKKIDSGEFKVRIEE